MIEKSEEEIEQGNNAWRCGYDDRDRILEDQLMITV